MSVITRWSVRTIAATAVLGIASLTSQAQVRFPVTQPKSNPIVIPPGPMVNPAGIPRVPVLNPSPVRVMPQINSFPGFPTYPAANPFTPSLTNNPFATPYTNLQPINPFVNNNPFLNPFNPLNNPLVNNNPFINNPFLLNPFVTNPALVNPFAVSPINPFAQPGFVNPVSFAQPVSPYQPGTLVMAGPNAFVNNSTGAVVQPITGTTFADGTTFYRAPTIGMAPPAYGYPRTPAGSVFAPYIW